MSLAARRLIERVSGYPVYCGPTLSLCETATPSARPLRLDQNENLFLPQAFVQGVIQKAVEDSDPRLYQSGNLTELRRELADYVGVVPDCVTVGAGGDDLIRLVTEAVLRQGDRTVIMNPT
ncbi:MAG: hypothetical protein HXY34_12565, partial [Candidatus Thorarchaeota archaeon]|nr:hypothetical protein [Candidatus Thorarchaeota archaeon]